jgi:hypothetical protein
MRNGAHASDSPENALRERTIVGLSDDNPFRSEFKETVEKYL